MPGPIPPLSILLPRIWLRRGPLACLLLPLSLLFGLLTAIRRGLYACGWLTSTKLPVPVIVVGNIFIGGTGKTPFVIWLVQALQKAGYVPGVISRGYGAAADAPRAVDPTADAATVGDEPLLIASRAHCPVMVGRQRVAVAQALLRAHPEINVIVSDDGLQHYAMQRDIEIVLSDERGNGNGWLLPAGPLREPAGRRRDFTVLNGAQPLPDMPASASRMQLEGAVAERIDGAKTLPLEAVPRVASVANLACVHGTLGAHGEPRIIAAAGIGNPSRFFALLHAAGINCIDMPLPDHYDFSVNPFAAIKADAILITEKDAVKCRRIDALKNDPRLWVVPVTARVEGALLERLLEKLRG
ncbi:MAG: tetraacyldisaccharide 4'-kinase [Proteobacteria bacterium]|nr:tetraacyldisaccharide 4'-kinase [Pseudomonadota bacterium]